MSSAVSCTCCAASTSAMRWSMSLSVITSPLTIAVALRTPVSCLSTKRTSLGMLMRWSG
jgi:hypothetical protein